AVRAGGITAACHATAVITSTAVGYSRNGLLAAIVPIVVATQVTIVAVRLTQTLPALVGTVDAFTFCSAHSAVGCISQQGCFAAVVGIAVAVAVVVSTFW